VSKPTPKRKGKPAARKARKASPSKPVVQDIPISKASAAGLARYSATIEENKAAYNASVAALITELGDLPRGKDQVMTFLGVKQRAGKSFIQVQLGG
jgi:hypothetical protein